MMIHRRAPLISAPKYRVETTMAKLITNRTSATRRICRGGNSEVPSITAIAGIKYITWRLTK